VGDTVTLNAGHGWVTGMTIVPVSTVGGLTVNTRYFINVSGNTVSFHTTLANAQAGTPKVDLTANITQRLMPHGIHSSTIYLVLDVSNQISLYTGTGWELMTTPEISTVLSGLTSGSNYDIFAVKSGSSVNLELSAAWAGDRTRTDALTTQDGVLVKSGSPTRRWLGTFRANSTTSTCLEWGASINPVTNDGLLLYNEYNQRQMGCTTHDGTSHSYTSTTWREWNAGTNSRRVKFVVGRDQFVNAQVGGYMRNSAYLTLGLNEVMPANNNYQVGSAAGCEVATNILTSGLHGCTPVTAGYNELVPTESGGGASGNFERYDAGVYYRG
jgi:hypothetical protein